MSVSRTIVWPRTADVARRLGVAAALTFVLTGGGRIVGSDELAMLELSRAMLHGSLAVPAGATLAGPDGRHYTKNAAGQAVLALPLVALAETVTGAAGVPEPRRRLAVKLVVSCFNAIVVAILLGVFYTIVRRLGVRPTRAFAAAAMLGFATPLWVYAKSFMADPLQALGLLLALAGCAGVGEDEKRGNGAPAAGAGLARDPAAWTPRAAALTGRARTSWMAGAGVCLAVSVKLSMLPLVLACMATLAGRPWRAWRAPLAGLVVALAGHAVYNVARFGTPFETGYGAQATAAAYTTPLWVGLYGLLVSSGKGVLWFAPPLWLALSSWLRGALPFAELPPSRDPEVAVPRGWARALAALTPEQRVRWGALFVAAVALVLYGRFQHWASDGSFGPRYLVPVLPLAFLVVALALERGSRTMLRWARVLAVLGFLVQAGGVAIYFGAQMREAGDYPYTLPLEHPRFMSESHFDPRRTPIVDHWRMLIRNAGEHLRGAQPSLGSVGASPPAEIAPGDAARTDLSAADQQRLLHALDFWWTYLDYAGVPRWPIVLAVIVAAMLTVWAWRRAWDAARREGTRP